MRSATRSDDHYVVNGVGVLRPQGALRGLMLTVINSRRLKMRG